MCRESFYNSMYAQEQKTVPIRNRKMISIIISLSKISWVLMQKFPVLCCYMSGDSLFTCSIGLSDSMLTPQGPPSPHQKAEQLLWPNVIWGGDSAVSKNRESRWKKLNSTILSSFSMCRSTMRGRWSQSWILWLSWGLMVLTWTLQTCKPRTLMQSDLGRNCN